MKKWKLSFLILLGLNLFILIVFLVFLFSPTDRNHTVEKPQEIESDATVPFLISTQKDHLTSLINRYLEEEADQENLNYTVELEDEVNVYGSVKAFNKDINMKLILEPTVKKDGNVQLHVKEMSIGQLQLPVSYVLKYMNTYYELPSYVVIDSSEKVIDIYLDELTFKNGLSARAESFNLKKDDITFTLYVPMP
ncbi:YpmS family protein [Metabacillus litoralis]|uniref:YpmS family protein n=1 Tax=Metabacillus litoralis TaxID=152268 RepID=UPI001CFCA4E3|nr:YpmS family protein [Metabacillus litoralis]